MENLKPEGLEGLLELERTKGIKVIRFDLNSPIISLTPKDCDELYIDPQLGGIWYQLKPSKMPIPMEPGLVYIYPAAMRGIQFNE